MDSTAMDWAAACTSQNCGQPTCTVLAGHELTICGKGCTTAHCAGMLSRQPFFLSLHRRRLLQERQTPDAGEHGGTPHAHAPLRERPAHRHARPDVGADPAAHMSCTPAQPAPPLSCRCYPQHTTHTQCPAALPSHRCPCTAANLSCHHCPILPSWAPLPCHRCPCTAAALQSAFLATLSVQVPRVLDRVCNRLLLQVGADEVLCVCVCVCVCARACN